MTLGHEIFTLAQLVRGLVILGTLVVVGKATIAYRQHASRPMLLLSVGLFLLLVVPPVFELAGEAFIEGSTRGGAGDPPSLATIGTLMLVEHLISLSGVGALLTSLYIRE